MILADLPFPEMPDFYRMLDVYVHPAADEYFGICFLEAMACGVPVVSHDSPTGRWIVGAYGDNMTTRQHDNMTSGPGGWCVDVGLPGFVGGIMDELTLKGREKGMMARAHVEAGFSHDAVYPRFMDMYRAVVEGGK